MRKKKILFLLFEQRFLRSIVNKFSENDDYEIYILGNKVEGLTKNVSLLNDTNYYLYDWLVERNKKIPWHIDSDIMSKYDKYLGSFLKMTDRLSIIPVHVKKRSHYFTLALNYCLYLIDELSPDIVFFGTTPHMGFDWLFMKICNENYVDTFAIERTQVGEFSVIVKDDCFNMIKLKNNVPISKKAFIETLEKPSLSLQRSKRFNDAVINRYKKVNISYLLKNIKRDLSLVFNNKKENSKIRSVVCLLDKEDRSKIKKGDILKKDRKHINSLRRFYRSLLVKPDLNKKYIFLPLHFQPEKTTLPLGGWYEDQNLLIRNLVENTPNDVLIYIKEHPRQFSTDTKKTTIGRDYNFYKEIAQIERAVLIDESMNSDDLIRNSIAVATVTGSAGWEALKTKKPVLLFGSIWYQTHPLCYKIKNGEDIKKAIEELKSYKYSHSHDEIDDFFNSIKDYIFVGTNFEEYAKKSVLGYGGILESTYRTLSLLI